jgi:hypothetical protein
MPPLDHLFVLSIMPCVATWMGLPGRAFFLFTSWKTVPLSRNQTVYPATHEIHTASSLNSSHWTSEIPSG